jgi:hypothetical protein
MDGVARINWCCPHCGAGQVLQLEVAGGTRVSDLHSILGGMALRGRMFEDATCDIGGASLDGRGGI